MQLAFAIAGAAIGTVLFPGAGTVLGMSAAGWGFMAGSMLGSMWVMSHQPAQNSQGPRLSDMRVSSGGSGYGTGIPKTYGSPRVSGVIIWASDLIETANTQTAGNKKTGKQSYTSYSYSVDCAVGICEGPIVGLRRIWANGKLIYDITGNGPVVDNAIIPLSGMTFYLGTEAQTANSVMQSRLGATNTPAYRGLAYAVFENIQLKDFGNRPPKFDFELGTGQRIYIGIDNYANKPWFSTDLITWTDRGNTPANYPGIKSNFALSNSFNQFIVGTQDDSNLYDGWLFRSSQNGNSWVNGPMSSDNDLELRNDETVNRWIYHDGQYMWLPDPYSTTYPTGTILNSSDGLTWSSA